MLFAVFSLVMFRSGRLPVLREGNACGDECNCACQRRERRGSTNPSVHDFFDLRPIDVRRAATPPIAQVKKGKGAETTGKTGEKDESGIQNGNGNVERRQPYRASNRWVAV